MAVKMHVMRKLRLVLMFMPRAGYITDPTSIAMTIPDPTLQSCSTIEPSFVCICKVFLLFLVLLVQIARTQHLPLIAGDAQLSQLFNGRERAAVVRQSIRRL